ncbi:MAG: SufE family protein [Alphaproteobacteria bacterium]|jgi:cysteine desulfuration protein SufE|nr:SufE family protein [Alphaproteobacteria bacterium]
MTQGSSTQNLQEMVENFSLFSDWEERYRYLIDLGRTLPEMDNALKTDENLVQGCTSRVWMVAGVKGGKFHFRADSDAHIVRGLIALLVVAYQDKPVAELTNIDVEGAFKKIGLDQNLSPNRRNGFFAMVERIKTLAETRA